MMSEYTNVRLVLQHLSPVKARDVLAALPAEAVARHNGDLWHTLWDELVTEILAPLNITFIELWRVPEVVFPEWYADGLTPFEAVVKAGEFYPPLATALSWSQPRA